MKAPDSPAVRFPRRKAGARYIRSEYLRGYTPQSQSYGQLMAAFGWVLWYRMTEPNAAPKILNYGTGGANLDGTPTDVSFGATGILGAGEAVDFNLATSRITLGGTNVNAVNPIPSFTFLALLNIRTAPAAGVMRRVFQFAGTNATLMSVYDDGSIEAKVLHSNASFTNRRSAANEVTFPTGKLLLAMTFSQANGMKVFKGQSGVMTEITNGSLTTGTGAAAAFNSTLTVGNNGAFNRAMDGPFDEFAWAAAERTAAELQQIATAAGI